MLFDGFTPMFSGIVGLALTAVLILGAGIASGFGSMTFRVVFWIVLGFGTASFFKYGIWPIIAMIATLVAVNFVIKGGRDTLAIMRGSLIDGAKQAVARRHRLRDRRRDHRRADADRRRVQLRRVRARDRQRRASSCRCF